MRLFLPFAAAVAAALVACERAEPAAAPAPDAAVVVGQPAPGPAVSAGPKEPAAVVIPPFDPSLPSLELAPERAPAPKKARAPAAKPRPVPRADELAATAKTEPDRPSLEALFRAPYPAHTESETVDLQPGPSAKPVAPKPPHALDRLGDNIRLERRGEAIGPAGARQGTAWETEAALRIPVDESVSVEGGVRVDSREEPGAKPQPSRKTPQVGVEVRF